MHSSNDPTVVAAAIATTRTTTPAHGIDDDDDGTAPPDNVDLWIKPVHSTPFVRMTSYQGIITEHPFLGLWVVRHHGCDRHPSRSSTSRNWIPWRSWLFLERYTTSPYNRRPPSTSWRWRWCSGPWSWPVHFPPMSTYRYVGRPIPGSVLYNTYVILLLRNWICVVNNNHNNLFENYNNKDIYTEYTSISSIVVTIVDKYAILCTMIMCRVAVMLE